VFQKYKAPLTLLFEDYASDYALAALTAGTGGEQRRSTSTTAREAAREKKAKEIANTLLSQSEWLSFLASFGMLLEGQGFRHTDITIAVSKEMAIAFDGVTKDHALLIFTWSQTFVTDEIKRRDKLMHLSYVDFLEAIARISQHKTLPSRDLLKLTGCKTPRAFFEKAKTGLLDPAVTLKEPYYIAKPHHSSRADEPLSASLEIFIMYMLERFNFTWDDDNRIRPPEHLAERAAAMAKARQRKRTSVE